MQIIDARVFPKPQIALVACAAPVMFRPLAPAIEDGLVLAVVVGSSQRQMALGPNDKGRPVTSCVGEGLLERMEFGGGHADVHSSIGHVKHIPAGMAEERLKS